MKKVLIVFLLCLFIFPSNIFSLNLNTESLIAKDISSGRVFYEKNPDDKRLIASTTKIMTCIVAIENGNLTDIVHVGEEVLSMYGSNIYIELNENMLLLDLLYGLILRSGNDAAIVISKYIGGTTDNFVEMMNNKAKELGMDDTIFNNPHGLDDDTKNYSTASDLAKLYSYAYKNETFREIVSTKVYKTSTDLKSYEWYNRNKILTMYELANGGKTGYTPSAKRVLVTSASNNDLDIVVASFNNIYDYDLHAKIYEDVFDKYKNYLLVDKDTFKINSSGDNYYIKESFSYPLTSDEYKLISTKVDINSNDDKIAGSLYIYLDNEIIKEIDIYKTIEKESLFFKIKKFIKNLA